MYIYKIVNNVNEFVYIGLTTRTPEIRMQEHITRSKKLDKRLYRAMRKYGVDNFDMVVIAELTEIKNADVLYRLECDYIKAFNSYWFGYNDTIGGRGVKQLKRGRKKQLKAY